MQRKPESERGKIEPMQISEFDSADADEAAAAVSVWAAIPHWIADVVAGRPYGTVEHAAVAAEATARQWSAADLDAALSTHPRIGEKPTHGGAEGAASRAEQASMSTASADLATALADANAAYEARFGRVFLVRAAGRSPQQMLSEALRRLNNDADAETAEALHQLREIALLRLRSTLTDQES